MLRFLIGLQVTNRKMNQDIEHLRTRLESTAKELLVPWSSEELELLSLNQHAKKIQKGFHQAVQGVFNSIYYEPVIAYAYKEYYNMARRAIIVARTQEHEFIYKVKTDRIEVFLDGQSYGLIKKDGWLINVYRKKIARIFLDTPEYLSTYIQKEHVANLLNPKTADDKQQRAIQLFQTLSSEQELVLLSLATPELIMRTHADLKK